MHLGMWVCAGEGKVGRLSNCEHELVFIGSCSGAT